MMLRFTGGKEGGEECVSKKGVRRKLRKLRGGNSTSI